MGDRLSVDPDWLVPAWSLPGIGALMTTRAGGASAGPFASMNLQLGGGDDDAAVRANRARLAAAAGAAPVFLRQVHGHRVVRVGRADAQAGAAVQAADACITTEPGVACTVLVADCLPVLFAAPDGRAVAAAHAGWRGLAGGVLEASVDAVCAAAGCAPVELQAWLGASIGPGRFQVGADVLQAFGVDPAEDFDSRVGGSTAGAMAGRDGAEPGQRPAHPCFVAERPGKWLADLPGLARDRLQAAGLRAISGGSWCTVGAPSRFFSFRRERVTGRMAAAIWIEPRR
jgi:YfiH family protein